MSDPNPLATEVIGAHQLGCFYDNDWEDVTETMIQEADDRLEAYVQWRIEQARDNEPWTPDDPELETTTTLEGHTP